MSNNTITWAGSITSNRSNKLAITVNHKRDRKMNRNIWTWYYFRNIKSNRMIDGNRMSKISRTSKSTQY